MANFPTTPATGSYFTTSGTTYKYVTHETWQVVAPDVDVKMSVVRDDHTKLLLKFDGPNNSTNVGFTGSSRNKHVAVPTNNAIISTASYVFGTSSAYFDGSGDYCTISDSEDWNFGSGDFTIEFWVYWNSLSGGSGFMGQTHGGSAEQGWYFYRHNSGIIDDGFIFRWRNTDGDRVGQEWSEAELGLVIDTWYHVALVRDGANLTLFLDGEEKAIRVVEVAIAATTLRDADGALTIGQDANGYQHNGYMDNVRITKGIARYSGSFVPNSGSDAFDFLPQPARPADETSNLQTLTLQSSSISAPDTEPTDVKFYVDKPAIDSYTSLLLHFDGGDEATSGVGFTDSSPTGHTVTVVGAKIDNGASVFGTSSVYFADDYLTIPSHSDFDMGTGDFTIETWATWDSLTSKEVIAIGVYTSGFEWVWLDTNRFKLYIANASAIIDGATDSFKPALNTWYHLAATRSGTDVRIFVDGQQIGSTGTSAGDIDSSGGSGLVWIGNENAVSVPWDGYMDEVRISKGIARYTSNFDPPKKQFGKPDLKLKDGSGIYTIKLKQIN